MKIPQTTGSVVARLRREKGLKQTVLAAALGITQSAYCRRESGTTALKPHELEIIAATLEVSTDEILRPAALRPAALRPAALRPAGKPVLSGEEEALLQQSVPVLRQLLQLADQLGLSA